jgi:multiple sugar transport system substrate-binding protein
MEPCAKRLTRRDLGRVLTTGSALVLAGACARLTTPSKPAESERSPLEGVKPGGKITWSFWAVSQEQADNTLARIAEFNQQNPHIQVEALWVSWGEYRSKIISLISAGTPPELTQVDAYDMPAFVEQQLIQPLDPYIKGDKSFNLDVFLPGAFLEDHHIFNGVYYSVPNGPESPRVLFYDRAKWLDAGLPLPNDLDTQGKWTWDSFLDALLRLSRGDGAARSFGIAAQLGVHPEPHSWIYSNGGKTLSDDRKTFIGDMAETVDALQFQADLIHKYNVAPRPGDDLGPGDPFLSHRLAMVLSGAWYAAPLFTRPDYDYGVAPLPKSPKGMRRTVVKPNSLTIPVGVTGQKAATAWELAKFITGPTYQKGLIDVGQALTNRKDLVDYFLRNSPIKNAKVFMDAYENREVLPIPLIPKWQEYNGIVTEEMNKVRRGEVSVREAMRVIKSRASAVLGGER